MPTNNKIVTIDVLAHFKELLCENVKNIYAGYYNSANDKFYEDSTYQTEIAGKAESIYINISTNTLYRWSGSDYIEIAGSGNQIQYSAMPNADASLLNTIVQYVGSTNLTYTNGFFYKCINNNGTYIWEQTNVQPASSGSVNIIEGYYNTEDDLFYEEDTFATEIIGAASTIYIDLLTSKTYRWNGTEFVRLDDEYIIATDNTVGFVKPDNVTTFVDTDGTLHARVWAGTLARYYVEKDKIPPDTEIILTDYDGIPPASYPDDYYVNGVKIVPWSTGSDADVKAMLAGADAGKININEYWQIGDIRTQHMDAIAANPNGAFIDGVAEGDVKLALMNKGYMGQNGIHFVVGQADGSHNLARMNATATTEGTWRDSAMRADLNNLYFNAFGETFRSCFKPFTVTTANTYNGTNLQTTTDYLALFAEKEVWGEGWKYAGSDVPILKGNETEARALSQIEYYKTNPAAKMHYSGTGEERTWFWWLRSPSKEMRNYFLANMAAASTTEFPANQKYCGIVPFFCI